MFTKLCGINACQISLATTWWEKTDFQDGLNREQELRNTPDFWGYMLSKGSRLERHLNDRESAMRLITSVVERGKSSAVALDLQKQMVDEKKTLIQTTAGMELEGELLKTTQKFQKQIDMLQNQHREAQKMQEKEMAKELEAQKKELTDRLRKTEREQADLQKNSQREHDRRFSELQAQLRAARNEADAREARQQRILEDQRETQWRQESQQKQEIERSGNFGTEYPSLESYLVQKKQYDKPVCLSLGPNGAYFARTKWACSRVLPADAESYIGDISKIKSMW
ncbi:MAG: hypothetical protein Q9204_003795 [Flavoplaca sp. TL-2023a]